MVNKDDPRLLGFLEAALDLRQTEKDGLSPQFDPSALLVLADWLQEQGDPRPDDLRQLGSARYFKPCGDHTMELRPIACGRWWCIEHQHPLPGLYAVVWSAYPGTAPYRRLEALYREEAPHAPPLTDLTNCDEGFEGSDPGVLRPPFGQSILMDARSLPLAFEGIRFALAAGLLGTTYRFVDCRARLLGGDDAAASLCLAHYSPPAELVRELRRRDPRRFRRLRSLANWHKKRLHWFMTGEGRPPPGRWARRGG
jgi:hypothetical protein